jgi:hypothetical protein
LSKANTGNFVKASDTIKNRIIGASYGEPGSGKTSFWLGAPGPIYIQSFDKGLEGVVEPYTKEKDIQVCEYDWSPAPGTELDQSEAIDLRDRFSEDFELALSKGRTVIWDTETGVWGLFKYAEFGVSEKGKPQDWDSLKQRCRRLINLPKALDINFGLIQSLKNEWVPSVNKKTGATGITQSGNRIRAGMDDVESLVHVNIEHSRKNGEFSLAIGKSRGPGSRDVQDKTFSNLSFVDFAQLVFPDSTEEDWT